MVFSGGSIIFSNGEHLLGWGADYGPLTLNGQYWRALTSSFLHFDVFHLVFNMIGLLWLGRHLEEILGSTVVVGTDLITGIGAATVSLCWAPLTISAGASGAILGIAGMLMVVLPYGGFKLSNMLLHRCTVLMIVLGFTSGFFPGTDTAAHFGGLGTGLLLGVFVAHSLRSRRSCRMILARAELYHGQTAIKKRDYSSAVHHLRIYVASRRKDLQGYVLLGYSLHVLREDDAAVQIYQHALALDPQNMLIQTNLAELYILQGKTAQAVALIKNGRSALHN